MNSSHSPCLSWCTRNGAQPFCGFSILILAFVLEASIGSIPILQAGTTTLREIKQRADVLAAGKGCLWV